MILVDSSVWIAAWRGADERIVATLSQLVESEAAAMNPLIRVELLQGAKDAGHQRALQALITPIPILSLEDIWEDVPRYALRWRSHGVTLTTIDAIIATQSIATRYALWSLDKVFTRIEGLPRFEG